MCLGFGLGMEMRGMTLHGVLLLCLACFSPCSLDRPISKRCANLSTCVLGKLSQELHKLQTYPRTDVGAGTPGKKRNVLNDLENERYANYEEALGNN